MSQQVTVDYQGVSIEVRAKCDVAIHSLCAIDKAINRVHEVADKLEDAKVKEYESYLLSSKKAIQNKIEAFKLSLEKYKEVSSYVTNNHDLKYQTYLEAVNKVRANAESLLTTVNNLTGEKLEVLNQLINENLMNVGEEVTKRLQNEAYGVLELDQSILNKINAIEDISLKELTYKEYINKNNKGLSFEALLEKGKEQYEILSGKRKEIVIKEYKEELKKNGVSTDIIDDVKNISEAKETVNAAIVGEKIRSETLIVIIKAIKARGFIVDTKKNLKIDKEKNVVKLVALKASGQKAEFEVQLNGKFMYHFEEYEGHACKKDIKPFLEDLKNIYDINITHEVVNWENPDKISTQKYQYVNKNKGTN